MLGYLALACMLGCLALACMLDFCMYAWYCLALACVEFTAPALEHLNLADKTLVNVIVCDMMARYWKNA